MVFCTGKISELKRTTKINNIFSKERETREIIAGPILLSPIKVPLKYTLVKKNFIICIISPKTLGTRLLCCELHQC